MAYVDHAISITDEEDLMETSYIIHNKPPIKEIALAFSLLVFGTLGIVIGFLMAYNHIGGDSSHVLHSEAERVPERVRMLNIAGCRWHG